MKVTRELQRDKRNADGYAPVRLVVSWEGKRLRVGTGCLVKPEHWDGKAQLVKVQNGTQHSSINPRLTEASNAAGEAQEAARKQGLLLGEAELRAALTAALTLAPAESEQPPAPVATQAAADFESLQRAWIDEQLHRPRGHSGKPMAQTTKAGLYATLQRFLQYAEARGRELRVEEMDLAFYQDFRTYLLDELGQGLNTFGKHVTRLKTFLSWAELERDVPVHRHYRKFTSPSKRGRVEALTETELRQVASLDFHDPARRAQLLALRTELGRSTGQYQGALSVEAWVAHVELARDKFLECCYTGLRISDANRAAWQHVRGNLLVLDNTAKNEATVYVPFYDDDIFQPVALANRYEHRSPLDLLVPECYRCNEFLRVVQRLAGFTRFKLTTKIGRKTFVTLKLYQGVAPRLIMQATGHQTEEAFNHYVGVDELKLVEEFMRKATRRRAA
ncbi:MAG: phage integrase SAM-like domain-containing protein [Janthinobacterium lividum]